MFQLVKILNGRINQPEPICLPVAGDAEKTIVMRRGSFLTLANGALVNCGPTDKPLYFCADSCTLAPGKTRKIPVFPLSPDMVFEAPVTYSDTPSPVVTGGLYTLAQTVYDSENELSFASGITDVSEGGTVRAYDVTRPDGDGKKIWVTVA